MSAKSLLQDLLGELADLHEDRARRCLSDDDIVRKSDRPRSRRDVRIGGAAVPAGAAAERQGLSRRLGAGARSAARRDPGLPHVSRGAELRSASRSISAATPRWKRATAWSSTCSAGTSSACAIRSCTSWMQVFSFAEDIASPFPGQFHGSQYDSGAGAGRAGSAGQLDRRAVGYIEGIDFDSEEGVRRFTRLSSASGSLAGVKITRAQEDPGRQRHLRLGQVPACLGSADADLPTHAAADVHDQLRRREPEGDRRRHGAGLAANLVTSLAFVPRPQGGPGMFALVRAAACERSRSCPITGTSMGVAVRGPGERLVPLGSGASSSSTVPTRKRLPRCGRVSKRGADPRTPRARHSTSRSRRTPAFLPSCVRIEGTLTQKAAQIRLPDARRRRDAQPRLVRQLHREDPAEGRAARGLRRRRRVSRPTAAAFYEGQIRSAGTGGNPRPTTPPPPGVQPPPLPPLPPETGPGFGLTIPIGKSLGPLTIHNLQLRFGSEDVDGKTTYLIQAASSISTKLGPVMARVDRAGLKFGVRIPRQGRRRDGQPRLRGRRRRRGAAQRRLARDRREGLRDRRRLPVPRQGAAGLRGRHAADGQGAHHRQGIRPHRHEDAGWQQGLLAHRLHHRRRISSRSRSAWRACCAASAAWLRSTARSTKRRCARACGTRRSALCCSPRTRFATRRRSFAT